MNPRSILPLLALALPATAGATVLLSENFDGGGVNSVFNYTSSSGTAPSTVNAGGANQNVSQITNQNGSNNNSIAWNPVAIPVTPVLRLSFDFNMTDDAANNAAGGCCGEAADGIGIGFFPTAIYGTSGGVNPATGAVAFDWERPNPAGVPVLTVGFDVFDAGGPNGNNVTVNWNGTVLGNVVPGSLLNDNAWHRGVLTITDTGSDSVLDFTIDGNAIHTGLLAPGVDLDGVGSNYRLIAGGRTGGAFVQSQLDNIMVEAVPEPSLGMLALAGLGAIGFRRRRSS